MRHEKRKQAPTRAIKRAQLLRPRGITRRKKKTLLHRKRVAPARFLNRPFSYRCTYMCRLTPCLLGVAAKRIHPCVRHPSHPLNHHFVRTTISCVPNIEFRKKKKDGTNKGAADVRVSTASCRRRSGQCEKTSAQAASRPTSHPVTSPPRAMVPTTRARDTPIFSVTKHRSTSIHSRQPARAISAEPPLSLR